MKMRMWVSMLVLEFLPLTTQHDASNSLRGLVSQLRLQLELVT